MKIKESKKVLQSEINLLKDICCQILGLRYDFNEWGDLYKIAIETLSNNVVIDNTHEANSLLSKIGVNYLADDLDIFIIDTMPTAVYKLNWGDLKILWDDIWCPPIQDGLLLYIPNHKMLLLTHWDTAYYN